MVRRRGADRRVAEAPARAVVVAVEGESAVHVAHPPREVPQRGREEVLAAEDAEHVRLGDPPGHVLAPAVVVLGDGEAGAGVVGGDLLLHPREKADRADPRVHRDPAVLGVGGVPERAGGLHPRRRHLGAVVGLGDAHAPAPRLRIPVQVEDVHEAPAGAALGVPHRVEVEVEEVAAAVVGGVLQAHEALPAVAHGAEDEGFRRHRLDRRRPLLGPLNGLRVGQLAGGADARVGGGPEVRLVVERVEERPRGVAARVGEGRLEPGHELVLVDDAVAGVGRVGEAAALRGARLEEPGVQVVRGQVHVAARRLVGGHVPGHGDGDDHRGPGRQRSRHVRAHRLAGHVAAAQEVVVLVAVVGAGVRGVRLPVVGGPAVAAQPPEPQASRPARPVGLVHAVDVGRDGVPRGGRVDGEADAPGRGAGAASARRTASSGPPTHSRRKPPTGAPGGEGRARPENDRSSRSR